MPQTLFRHRFGPAVLLVLLLVALSTLTRIALLIKAAGGVDWTIVNVAGLFLVGLFYDLVAAVYMAVPLVFYLWLLPNRVYRSRVQQGWLFASFGVLVFVLLFTAVAEWVFWDEFGSRFNFIAVDYLLYTQEVVRNVWESYPVGKILLALALLAVGISWAVRRPLLMSAANDSRWLARTVGLIGWLALPTLAFLLVTGRGKEFSDNSYVAQLAGNGIYEFFAANRNNELDYATFYAHRPDDQVAARLKPMLKTPEATFVAGDRDPFARKITHAGPEQRLNVVLISVESLSADYLGSFGNTQGLTPNLDKLAKDSLFFGNLYAVGTRTVRGLEALSLAQPPTPGQSIVRRPNNENLYTLGWEFRNHGYSTAFLYGGYGYFDNMNAFFGANGYDVVDRTAIPSQDIHHENVWGVADEDLYTLALKEADKRTAKGKPFFFHVMTTSNHRPFTYPDGRIDIPSASKSREGGVKYTDWSIADFLKRASTRPWFDNTVFIITADHCASSAGKTDLPVDRYHIPMMIYSPKHVKPGRMDRLMSQIDIAPTLLGMLNFSYTSHFFGYDINQLEPGRERIFISTYQDVGYIHDGKMAILQPRQQVSVVPPNFADGSASKITPPAGLVEDTIAWYQGASNQFRDKLSRVTPLP